MRRLAFAACLLLAPALAQAQDGDAEAGRRVFNQCRACHTADQGGRNGVGPNLFGIVGRRAGSIEGFRYSANMQELAGTGHVWTPENLRAYVRDPKAVLPRGAMAFVGLRNDTQLNDIVAYLNTLRTN